LTGYQEELKRAEINLYYLENWRKYLKRKIKKYYQSFKKEKVKKLLQLDQDPIM